VYHDPTSSIVIGGGLAGAAFALELARNGERVRIIEKSPGIHHKVCGEFLSVEAQTAINRLGLDVWALGAASVSRLRLSCGAYSVTCPLPFRGAGLSRARLDEALVTTAAKAGAELLRGVRVSQLQCGGSSALVRTPKHSFLGKTVALATGKHDMRGLSRPRTRMLSFKMQLRLTPAAIADMRDVVQLTLFAGGYAGLCLVEEDIATACWVFDQEKVQPSGTDWPAQCGFLSRQSGVLSDLLQGAQPRMERPVAIASIPYGFLRREAISDSVYPVGDQLAVIPSYTGDGTSIALHSGMLAASSVLNGHSAGRYQKAILSRLKPQMRWACTANLMLTQAALQRPVVFVAQKLPALVPRVVALLAGATRLDNAAPYRSAAMK
jgi:menaquinone-9 beta-reductase